MNAILRRAAAVVSRTPKVALAVLVALTVVLGIFAGQQTTDTDLAAFAGDSELAVALETVNTEFGEGGSSVQVIVDDGEGGDVLDADGLAVAQAITDVVADTPEAVSVLAQGSEQNPAIITYAVPIQGALVAQELDPTAVDDTVVDATAVGVFADPSTAQASALLSGDLTIDEEASSATAQGGLVIVRFAADASASDTIQAELALDEAIEAAAEDGAFGDTAVAAFGEGIFNESITEDLNAQLPMLLGISLLLIVGIMYLTYRRISDVLLGFTGLLITIMWTFGFAVLLGPDYLGVTGYFSQIATVVPVLLIGLGIDYAIHLTSRYTEEEGEGRTPAEAAGNAVFSVGGALVLATVTTLIGFLTNLASPLPPIADFGIFVAVGVLSAFIVMVLLIPSARNLLDTRRASRGAADVADVEASAGPNALGRLLARSTTLSTRFAWPTVAVALSITILAGLAGSQISTTFSQDDFIPEGSDIDVLLTQLDELFGGDIDETTYVLLEGDLTTPEAANAQLAAGEELTVLDGVRAGQVTTPAGIVAQLSQTPDLAEPLAALGVRDGTFAPDADVVGAYELARTAAPGITSLLTEDGQLGLISMPTTVGQEGVEAFADAARQDLGPLEDAGLGTTVVSSNLVNAETLDQLTSSQTQGIIITLVAALLVLVTFYTVRERTPLLGIVTMVPSIVVVAMVLGSMWALGISFNVLTAMVASLAIGIGVPFGIHITHRFTEEIKTTTDIDAAIHRTVSTTGSALFSSAATTAAGFGVLAFSSLVTMQQFGLVTALTIVYSLLGALFVQPSVMKLVMGRRMGAEPEPVATATSDAADTDERPLTTDAATGR